MVTFEVPAHWKRSTTSYGKKHNWIQITRLPLPTITGLLLPTQPGVNYLCCTPELKPQKYRLVRSLSKLMTLQHHRNIRYLINIKKLLITLWYKWQTNRFNNILAGKLLLMAQIFKVTVWNKNGLRQHVEYIQEIKRIYKFITSLLYTF